MAWYASLLLRHLQKDRWVESRGSRSTTNQQGHQGHLAADAGSIGTGITRIRKMPAVVVSSQSPKKKPQLTLEQMYLIGWGKYYTCWPNSWETWSWFLRDIDRLFASHLRTPRHYRSRRADTGIGLLLARGNESSSPALFSLPAWKDRAFAPSFSGSSTPI